MRRLTFIFILLLFASDCLALQKNVSSQKWIVFAFDETDNTAKTGDAANITANLRIDGAAANAVDDTNPTELEDGYYIFDITNTESNGDSIVICPASTTADIQVIGCPMALWTTPPYFPTMSIDSNGRLDIIKVAGTTQTANDNGADINAILTDTADYDTDAEYAEAIWGAAVASYNDEADFGGELGGLDPNLVLVLEDTSAFDTAAEYGAAIWNATTASFGGANTYANAVEDVLAGTVTNAQGTDVATDVAALIGTDSKALISTDAQDLSGSLSVNTKTFTAGSLANATFNADVGSTAHGTNIIALACRKILEELNLDHWMKVATSNSATLPEVVDDTVLANILTKTDGDTSDYDFTTDSLEALQGAGSGNITQILGTAVTESNAGDVAESFSFFFDVDPVTTKDVDDVGAPASGGGSPLAITAGNLGDYKKNSTVYFIWRTVAKDGAAINPSTAGTVKVYKNNGTSEVTAPHGITDTRGFDSLTGIHLCAIDLSANSFYAIGHDYSVVLTGATIDTESATAVIATFSIEHRYTEEFWDYQ